MKTLETNSKRFYFPNTYVLLFCIAITMAILSHIVPAGSFERVLNEATGRTAVVPGSFDYITATPTTLKILFSSVYVGFKDCIDIIGLLLIMGAAMGVIVESGAIHAIIACLVKKLGAKTDILFVILMICFAIASSVVGMAEELIVFIPLILTVCRALNYDDLTACAVLLLGIYSSIGFSPISPYNLIIAQTIAEVPLYSGLELRLVGLVGAVIIAICYVIHYSRKCARNPQNSLLYNKSTGGYILNCEIVETSDVNLDQYELTAKRKIVLIITLATIVSLVVGVILYKWYFEEMCALFFALGIVVSLIQYRGNFNDAAEALVKNAGTLIGTAVLLALSRSIVYILTDAQLMDTFVYWISIPLSHLSGLVAAWGIYISQLVVNFFIPSSSGQAMVVMPVLTPLCDLVGIPRNVAVHAFMTADCYGNLIIPTHPTTLAVLGLAGVPWLKWFRFAWKVVLLFSIWSLIIISIGYFVW